MDALENGRKMPSTRIPSGGSAASPGEWPRRTSKLFRAGKSWPKAWGGRGLCDDFKVFVGGIPQELNDEDLHNIFSKYGRVAKAWLQRFKEYNPPPPQYKPVCHRGFGFVVFSNESALDLLLGDEDSCFIKLQGERKVEVKRAVAQHLMHGESNVNRSEKFLTRAVLQQDCEEQAMTRPSSNNRRGWSEPQTLLDRKPWGINSSCRREAESPLPPIEEQGSQHFPGYWPGASLRSQPVTPLPFFRGNPLRSVREPADVCGSNVVFASTYSFTRPKQPRTFDESSGLVSYHKASMNLLFGLLASTTPDDARIAGTALQLGAEEWTVRNLERTLVEAMPDHYDD